MPKPETKFVCQACGQDFPRWSGQCASCGEWNTLVEEQIRNPKSEIRNKSEILNSKLEKPIPITEVDFRIEERMPTGLAELDRVLGGGVVAGSAVLVAGEPGIGKSTMMLQTAEALAKKSRVLYVSGEESVKQIRLRAERLGTLSKNLILLPETNLFAIENSINEVKPSFVVIDSIQTLFREDVTSAASSVAQVRECAAYLVRIAKTTGIPIFIVGHATKEGTVAGPRVLEHVVDTVLYFEGEQHKQYRLLRATKNRFGSTQEVGIFEMKENGLAEVANPSELFLSERAEASPGSVITAAIEGTRPLLVEIQALVAPTKMAYPIRKATGVDYNRVSIIIAVLERHLGFKLSSMDVYVNAAGGVRTVEPAIDLPIALAIASGYKNKLIDHGAMAIGEIGLAGELRSVNHIEQRVREAEKLGFKTVYLPAANVKELKKAKIKLAGAASIKDALTAALQ
ncbi:MAG: DNA repair protein RadA [Candidatus Margulisbacteria bacterium]|nr:DNA repair protein RadA [Candidatus Margulisiibacteriota bacterium]